MKPRLLDLFCGAGGAGAGYQRAGFRVTGVDVRPHPACPYNVWIDDALNFVRDRGNSFDVIHASPPCQAHTTMSNRWRGAGGKADGHTDLIGEVRTALIATGLPYVIENVAGARPKMQSPLLLHGGMFGLGVYRPRLFEISIPIGSPPAADPPENPVGVYGKSPDGRRLWTRKDRTHQRAAKGLEEGQRAMGIDWMEWHDLTEAIPPAYTEWIGRQLLAHLTVERVA